MRRLAQATGMGSSTINRILNAGSIKPHKIDYWCGRSTDPEFEEKQAAFLDLYLHPQDNALILSIDEKSQIQALDQTQPTLVKQIILYINRYNEERVKPSEWTYTRKPLVA